MAIWVLRQNVSCHQCTRKDIKLARGCDGHEPRIIDDIKIEIDRCPLKIINACSNAYLEAYNFYKNGYLPYSGGWLNQPAKFMNALHVIETEMNRIQDKESKKNGK